MAKQSWPATGLSGVVLIACAAFCGPSHSQALTGIPADSPAAIVNGESILAGDLFEELTMRYGQSVLEELILEWMTETKATELAITVDRSEAVKIACEQLSTEERPLATATDLTTACAQAGVDPELLIHDIRFDLLAAQVLGAEVEISEEELRTIYERQPDSFASGFQAHVRMILLGDEQTAMGLAPGLSPETFAGMAQQFSGDDERRASGGDWGFVGIEQLPENADLRAFVESASAGDISPVIETNEGWALVLVEEILADAPLSFEQARDTVHALVFEQKKAVVQDGWVERARRMARMLSLDAMISELAPLPSQEEALRFLEMAEDQEERSLNQDDAHNL